MHRNIWIYGFIGVKQGMDFSKDIGSIKVYAKNGLVWLVLVCCCIFGYNICSLIFTTFTVISMLSSGKRLPTASFVEIMKVLGKG